MAKSKAFTTEEAEAEIQEILTAWAESNDQVVRADINFHNYRTILSGHPLSED